MAGHFTNRSRISPRSRSRLARAVKSALARTRSISAQSESRISRLRLSTSHQGDPGSIELSLEACWPESGQRSCLFLHEQAYVSLIMDARTLFLVDIGRANSLGPTISGIYWLDST